MTRERNTQNARLIKPMALSLYDNKYRKKKKKTNIAYTDY